jgi:vanillate O-demethylase ferredoxin subunit
MRRIASGTMRISFASRDGCALPSFAPGAHLELQLGTLSRRYSLTSSPSQLQRYEICVLRTAPSRGGSEYLHHRLRVGDVLDGAGPFNAFPLDSGAAHSVLIAGGIGITPFFSMMVVLERAQRPFELHYAARSIDRFLPLPLSAGSIHRYAHDLNRRMDVNAILQSVPSTSHVYVCGPRGLVQAVRGALAAREWPRQQLHFESFGAALQPTDLPLTVRLARSDMRIEVPTGTTILDALLAHGVWAPFECRRGECAACVTEVLAGIPDHRDVCLTDVQRRQSMCTCISWAHTPDLVLNL